MNRTKPLIWRVHIRPDSEREMDPVQFCLNQGVIGIGWQVAGKPTTREEYQKLGEKKYGNTGWRKATNAFLYRMSVGDLVWMRDFCGVYYLGRVDSDWKYADARKNQQADLVNVRKAKLHRVSATVPGKIAGSFRPGATVQDIKDDTVCMFSMIVFNEISEEEQYALEEDDAPADLFSLLSDVDLEDVVGIYLQSELDYLMIPSTRSPENRMPFVGYYLISPENGHHAGVQVKCGSSRINRDDYAEFTEKIYLFSPAGYLGIEHKNTISISRDVIEQFATEHEQLMPFSVRTWLKYIAKLAGMRSRL